MFSLAGSYPYVLGLHSEIVNSGTGEQPDGAALPSEGQEKLVSFPYFEDLLLPWEGYLFGIAFITEYHERAVSYLRDNPQYQTEIAFTAVQYVTGRQPRAATATLLEQNLQLRPAPAPPRRSSRIEGLPPQNFKEPDGRKNPGVGGADREDLTCFL